MLRYEVYHNNHIRSLFISKFFYFSRSEIMKLKSIRVSIIGQFTSFPVIVLFLYFLTGCWPVVKNLTKRNRSGVLISKLRALSTIIDSGRIFLMLNKFVSVYLPAIESWAYKPSMLIFFKKSNGFFSLRLRSLFYIFFELDFLLNFSFTFLKVLTASWVMEIFFDSSSRNVLEQQAFLRTFMVPTAF